ncbi:MAG: PspC domain-containing protein [Taibaiella sp.]|nr:PspC domain-containing protein [Taibaiella sp.]
MNKIININLGGRMIAIDESAYEQLRQYINWLRQYFGKEEGGLEIAQDMEQRIAEIFEDQIRKGKVCIMTEDVLDMIQIMGSPEQLQNENEAEENSNAHSHRHSFAQQQATSRRLYRNEKNKLLGGVCAGIADYFHIDPIIVRLAFIFGSMIWGTGILIYIILWLTLPHTGPSVSGVTRRLYRNTDKKVLGGVCSGLAGYFNTDPVIVRILFALPLLLTIFLNAADLDFLATDIIEGGIPMMFLLYMLLWISVPAAHTVSEKLELMGARVDVQNVSSAMRNQAARTNPVTLNSVLATLLKIFVFCILAVILMVLLTLTITVAGGVIGYGLGPFEDQFPFYRLIVTDTHTEIILWASVVLILSAPLVVTILLMRRVLTGRKYASNKFLFTLMPILFILGVSGFAFSISDINDQFRFESSGESVHPLATGQQDTLRVRLYSFLDNKVKTRKRDFENPILIPINKDQYALKVVSLDIQASKAGDAHLQIDKSASGHHTADAEAQLAKLSYDYAYADNLLSLPDYIVLDQQHPYRTQEIRVTLYLPEGKVFKVDPGPSFNFKYRINLGTKEFSFHNGLKGDWDKDQLYTIRNGQVEAIKPASASPVTDTIPGKDSGR